MSKSLSRSDLKIELRITCTQKQLRISVIYRYLLPIFMRGFIYDWSLHVAKCFRYPTWRFIQLHGVRRHNALTTVGKTDLVYCRQTYHAKSNTF